LLTAVGTALAGWVAMGSDRSSYAGLQAAFAFYMCIFQGFAPETNFTTIRDRLVGIALGIVVSTIVFHHLWPERAIDGLRLTLARVLRNLSRLLVLVQIDTPLEAAGKGLDKIRTEITQGLDQTITLSELMIFEQRNSDTLTAFSPARLENMVAGSQALSLMIMALHGRAKLEEWQRQEPAAQSTEIVLRAKAAEYLEQTAVFLESEKLPDASGLEAASQTWTKIVMPVTNNDRPRLVRRILAQSTTDRPINESEGKYYLPLGRRPNERRGLFDSELQGGI